LPIFRQLAVAGDAIRREDRVSTPVVSSTGRDKALAARPLFAAQAFAMPSGEGRRSPV
jgi:hypothetical protein